MTIFFGKNINCHLEARIEDYNSKSRERTGPGFSQPSYLIGAIPFGIIAGRVFADLDVRQKGSGNIGATNVARTAGNKRLGLLVLMLDAIKGIAPVYADSELLTCEF